MAFSSINYAINKVKKDPRFKRGLERVEVFKEARKVIEKLLGFEKCVLDQDMKFEFRGSVLYIKCANSYLAQELRFYQDEIKNKTNRALVGSLIKEIKVKVSR